MKSDSSHKINKIENLYKSIPAPQKTIINGVIDEMKFSKKQLVLITENNERVIVLQQDSNLIASLKEFFGKEITLTGTAHFKPGGNLSYVNLESFGQPGKSDKFFSKRPRKMSIQQQVAYQLREGKKKNPIDEIIGQWPGDESDEEFDEMLKDLD